MVTKGHNAASEHVADGLTLLTRTCLSRFRSWVVLPWPSHSFDIKDAIDFRHLKQQVGADFVLELTVDWRSQVAKLYASLIHCESGREDWAETFDITDDNLQDVTNSVAGRIASTLSIQIDHIIVRRFARSDGQNPAAYDAWIRGHQLARRWTVEDDMAAIALFERAIAIDAGLACAYTSLAAILSTAGIVRPGYAGADEDRRRAFTLSQEAILLDPSDARNHIGMAWSLMIAGTPERALSHFRLAVELNPHDAETLIASSQGSGVCRPARPCGRMGGACARSQPAAPALLSRLPGGHPLPGGALCPMRRGGDPGQGRISQSERLDRGCCGLRRQYRPRQGLGRGLPRRDAPALGGAALADAGGCPGLAHKRDTVVGPVGTRPPDHRLEHRPGIAEGQRYLQCRMK